MCSEAGSDRSAQAHRGRALYDVVKHPPELANNFFQRGPGQRAPNSPTPPPATAAPPAPAAGPRDAFDVPERENGYPEPSMFGLLPACGLFVRHAKNVSVEHFETSFAKEDTRPAIVLRSE